MLLPLTKDPTTIQITRSPTRQILKIVTVILEALFKAVPDANILIIDR